MPTLPDKPIVHRTTLTLPADMLARVVEKVQRENHLDAAELPSYSSCIRAALRAWLGDAPRPSFAAHERNSLTLRRSLAAEAQLIRLRAISDACAQRPTGLNAFATRDGVPLPAPSTQAALDIVRQAQADIYTYGLAWFDDPEAQIPRPILYDYARAVGFPLQTILTPVEADALRAEAGRDGDESWPHPTLISTTVLGNYAEEEQPK